MYISRPSWLFLFLSPRTFSHSCLFFQQLSFSVIVCGLRYFHDYCHLAESSGHILSFQQLLHVLVSSFVCSSKFLDDNTYTNKTWALVTGCALAAINETELDLLAAISFKLRLHEDDYAKWIDWLFHFVSSSPPFATTVTSVPQQKRHQQLQQQQQQQQAYLQQQQQRSLPQQQQQQQQQPRALRRPLSTSSLPAIDDSRQLFDPRRNSKPSGITTLQRLLEQQKMLSYHLHQHANNLPLLMPAPSPSTSSLSSSSSSPLPPVLFHRKKSILPHEAAASLQRRPTTPLGQVLPRSRHLTMSSMNTVMSKSTGDLMDLDATMDTDRRIASSTFLREPERRASDIVHSTFVRDAVVGERRHSSPMWPTSSVFDSGGTGYIQISNRPQQQSPLRSQQTPPQYAAYPQQHQQLRQQQSMPNLRHDPYFLPQEHHPIQPLPQQFSQLRQSSPSLNPNQLNLLQQQQQQNQQQLQVQQNRQLQQHQQQQQQQQQQWME